MRRKERAARNGQVSGFVRRSAIAWALLSLLWAATACAGGPVDVAPAPFERLLGNDIDVYVDQSRALGIDDIVSLPAGAFRPTGKPMPNFSFSPHVYWFRLRIRWDPQASGTYLLSQQYPLSDHLALYRANPGGGYSASRTGDQYPFASREIPVRAFSFVLPARPGQTETFYLSLHGAGTIYLDPHLADAGSAQAASETRHLMYGLYYGALLALLVYNLVLYRWLRERVYLYYTIYVAALGATFFDINGLAFRYWWPDFPPMNTWFLVFSFIALHALLQFTRSFLELAANTRLLDRLFRGAMLVNAGCFFALWWLPVGKVYAFTQVVAMAVSVLVLVAGVTCWHRRVQSAHWYTLATGSYVAGVVVYTSQNFGWLGASMLANHAVQVGSAVEMAILSLALAERVRQMKADRLAIAAEAHSQLLQSHQHLEQRVQERTAELMDSLDKLGNKHERLIAAQQQLVHAEKMSSLGGLVAGVAHEINNPAHFTRIAAENIGRDVTRLREFLHAEADAEVDAELLAKLDERFERLREQLSLIHDGTGRLARIVGDLRLFSRQDESRRQLAAPDEGLSATLNLVRAQYGAQVEIRLAQHDPEAAGTCNPAALNQVFMNLAVNACQAILGDPERAGRPRPAGVLEVESRVEQEGNKTLWVVDFRDDGPGIPESVLPHVFEPFYTTKAVGEGTGLGLSVSYGIIRKHEGEIRLTSRRGEGACFTVRLPLIPERSA